jgi:hypothetical protein
MKRAFVALAASAAIATAFALPTAGFAQHRVRVGTLNCDVSGGIGMIITSKKEVRCMYSPEGRGPREAYIGSIEKFGLDIGATTGGQMVWAVYAPTRGGRYALAGHYAGASAEATVGAGAGANALIGGSRRTVTLQPLSVQAQAGLNLAVGVAGLTLHPARVERR